MSMLSPAAVYQRQQSTSNFDTDNNHHLIKVTLEYLAKSLAHLKDKPERTSERHRTHTTRALTALYILQTSLDFEQGGDIATNLFKLYEYAREQVLKAMRSDDDANLDQAHSAISEILDAWQQIK
ncbi:MULTISPECIES: flagellar export chaperone FliS [Planktotalea]|jgi:flagellar protein FliS|uniref:flagellar export chaperone FliS n=1 Tax=Planktotalea TaxID=1195766 RepID=UPI001FE6D711|nr:MULTISPECIES: flagellar protein FliS [Planktotalea]